MRKLFLSHTVQHVYTDQEIKDMVKKSIGLDKSKVTEYRCVLVGWLLCVFLIECFFACIGCCVFFLLCTRSCSIGVFTFAFSCTTNSLMLAFCRIIISPVRRWRVCKRDKHWLGRIRTLRHWR